MKANQVISETDFAGWLLTVAPWDTFGTYTYALERSVEGARRNYQWWHRKNFPAVPTFYAIEMHPGGHGAHIHALHRLGQSPRRHEVWASWWPRLGRARVSPIEKIGGCSGYCSKYAVKEAFKNGWWMVLGCGTRYMETPILAR